MTIKDVETQTGLARANIRYYEAEGLISPERAENGYREYSQEDAETLLRVKLLRALGLTVGQIKAIVRGGHARAAAPERPGGGDRRTSPAGACAVPDARRKAVSR